MGFGLLLIGYLITYIMALNPFGAAFRVLGYILIAYAGYKLSAYEGKFRLTCVTSSVLALLSVFDTAQLVCEKLLIQSVFTGIFVQVMFYIEALFVFALQIVLLLAVRKIAKDTEVYNIQLNAGRNIFFVGLYFAFSAVMELPFSLKEEHINVIALILVI